MTTLKTFALPRFNLNGTAAGDIKHQYSEALTQMRRARETIAVCTCHPRDFQFQEPSVFNAARTERENILRSLSDIENYLQAWLLNAVEQSPEHN